MKELLLLRLWRQVQTKEMHNNNSHSSRHSSSHNSSHNRHQDSSSQHLLLRDFLLVNLC